MKLILFGATGGTGRELLTQALQRGHTATAFVRNAQAVTPRENLTVVKGDVLDAQSVQAAIASQPLDAVLSALGNGVKGTMQVCSEGTRNIATAMQAAGLKRLIVVSSLGLANEFNSWFVRKVIIGMMLAEAHTDLRRMEAYVKPLPLDWTLVRPPRLIDTPRRGQYRVLLAPDGKQLSEIARADVADFMLKELEQPRYIRQCPGIGY